MALACTVPVDELDVFMLVAELRDQGVVRLAPRPGRTAVDNPQLARGVPVGHERVVERLEVVGCKGLEVADVHHDVGTKHLLVAVQLDALGGCGDVAHVGHVDHPLRHVRREPLSRVHAGGAAHERHRVHGVLVTKGLVVDGGVDEVGVDVATLAVQVDAVVADIVVVAFACAVPVDDAHVGIPIGGAPNCLVVAQVVGRRSAHGDEPHMLVGRNLGHHRVDVVVKQLAVGAHAKDDRVAHHARVAVADVGVECLEPLATARRIDETLREHLVELGVCSQRDRVADEHHVVDALGQGPAQRRLGKHLVLGVVAVDSDRRNGDAARDACDDQAATRRRHERGMLHQGDEVLQRGGLLFFILLALGLKLRAFDHAAAALALGNAVAPGHLDEAVRELGDREDERELE